MTIEMKRLSEAKMQENQVKASKSSNKIPPVPQSTVKEKENLNRMTMSRKTSATKPSPPKISAAAGATAPSSIAADIKQSHITRRQKREIISKELHRLLNIDDITNSDDDEEENDLKDGLKYRTLDASHVKSVQAKVKCSRNLIVEIFENCRASFLSSTTEEGSW